MWSANLGGMYPSKIYYAPNRSHGGELNSQGGIKKEGLVVSDNTIQLVQNIIDGRSNSLPSGISREP